ncbi:MAG: hypothetical protein DLM61_18735 [Pseudonocardiales bacterium]|nr:MAG: hypothetical protein DLM61_18735 [Pseudonocardiales bacterium]
MPDNADQLLLPAGQANTGSATGPDHTARWLGGDGLGAGVLGVGLGIRLALRPRRTPRPATDTAGLHLRRNSTERGLSHHGQCASIRRSPGIAVDRGWERAAAGCTPRPVEVARRRTNPAVRTHP